MKHPLMSALAGVLFAGALTTFAGAQTTDTPAPKATQQPVYFGAADYVFSPNVTTSANIHGNNGKGSYSGRFGAKIPLKKLTIMAEGDYQTMRYDSVPRTQYRANTWDGKLGIELPIPDVFIAASYLQRSEQQNIALRNLQGWGVGLEKLPTFNTKLYSVYGSYYYYPRIGAGNTTQFHVSTYRAGVEFHPNPSSHSPFFLDLGYLADHGAPSKNAPLAFDDRGIYSGLGLHF